MTKIDEFINGVRVTTIHRDSDFVGVDNEKTTQVIDYLTKIAKLLGPLWTVRRHPGNYSWYGLLYNGGIKSANGIEFSFFNSSTYTEYKNRPDYWKFEVHGTYPQPDNYSYHLRTNDAPSAGIRIDNPKRAAADITRRLIPGVTDFTQKARENCVVVAQKERDYKAALDHVAQIAGRHVSNHDLSKSECDFYIGSYPTSTKVRVYRGTGRIDYSTSLSIEDLDKVMAFVSSLRNLPSEGN